jgi:hypothetical protein
LNDAAQVEIVDYDAATTLVDTEINPGEIASRQLLVRMNRQDLEHAMEPAVRVLDRSGRVLQILPIVFAANP